MFGARRRLRSPRRRTVDGGRGVRRRRRRWPWVSAVLVVLVLVTPVPWKHVVSEDPLGTAWRLDGRLTVNEQVINPPGAWSWLAVGRPALVGELLLNAVSDAGTPVRDLRDGQLAHRPVLSDPAAAAVGLRHAGRDIPMRLLVRVSDPTEQGLPPVATLTAVNGVAISDREALQAAMASGPLTDWEAGAWNGATSPTNVHDPQEPLRFTTSAGEEFVFNGPGLPYRVVTTLDVAPDDLEARIRFAALELLPTEWFRNLSLGSSHGMMVALTTYAQAADHDLAQGRHIAGTGGVLADGTVTRISGLPAKARAANRAGADVLLVPASQRGELDDVELPGTRVVGVRTVEQAIAELSVPVT